MKVKSFFIYLHDTLLFRVANDVVSTKGHYYAYFFNFATQIWFRLNDKAVIEVEEQVVLNDAFSGVSCACALQYIRCNPSIVDQYVSIDRTIGIASRGKPTIFPPELPTYVYELVFVHDHRFSSHSPLPICALFIQVKQTVSSILLLAWTTKPTRTITSSLFKLAAISKTTVTSAIISLRLVPS